MKQAYLTVLVDGFKVAQVIDHLHDLGAPGNGITVLDKGDISVTEKNLSTLPNTVCVHHITGTDTFALVHPSRALNKDEAKTHELTPDELQALKAHGVCVSVSITHPNTAKCGTPAYASFDAAAMAQVCAHGFEVDDNEFQCDFGDDGTDGAEQHWMVLRVPAWMNFEALLK